MNRKRFIWASIFLIVIGFIGYLLSLGNILSMAHPKKLDIPFPLNNKNGLVVDSSGNYYIGEGESKSIQVYNPKGEFEYGFSFPTNLGGFTFGIEKETDRIHVITYRGNRHFIFHNGDMLLEERGISYEEAEGLEGKYKMSVGSTYVDERKGLSYHINVFNTIVIEDRMQKKTHKIHLDTPIWPLPSVLYYLALVVGFLSLLFMHIDTITKKFGEVNIPWKKKKFEHLE